MTIQYKRAIQQANGNVRIDTIACPDCGGSTSFFVPRGAFEATKSKHVQDAMPMLSVSDRERLISGMCDPCWTRLFALCDD